MPSRFADWLHRTMPKREELEANRFVAPFARRHELWRFTRRSVPRGVAIGLLVGIFALIPGVHYEVYARHEAAHAREWLLRHTDIARPPSR